IRTNSPTGGLAEGLCDLAVLRTAADSNRFASAIVGHERRYCALAADDPWARRRSIKLREVPQRTVLIDRRTGTTTPDLWPADTQPPMQEICDIDDWLAIIAAGGGIGITPEGTTAQYRRDGVVFRPLQVAPPIAVRMIWRRHDPHPSTHAAVAMPPELSRGPSCRVGPSRRKPRLPFLRGDPLLWRDWLGGRDNGEGLVSRAGPLDETPVGWLDEPGAGHPVQLRGER